jgi:hypothetical protein
MSFEDYFESLGIVNSGFESLNHRESHNHHYLFGA